MNCHPRHSYEQGGYVGPGGTPQRPAGLAPQGQIPVQGMMPPQPMAPQSLDMRLEQGLASNPQVAAALQQAVQQAMQSGVLTPDELNTLVQLATVAMQNPQLYPQVRAFAMQNGLGYPDLFPEQMNPQALAVIMAMGRVAQPAPQQMPQQGMPSMATGGAVPDSRRADGSVPINAHEGEYVIPAHVVRMKGREFFDNMLEKYKDYQ